MKARVVQLHSCMLLQSMLQMEVVGKFWDVYRYSNTEIYLHDTCATQGYWFVTHPLD